MSKIEFTVEESIKHLFVELGCIRNKLDKTEKITKNYFQTIEKTVIEQKEILKSAFHNKMSDAKYEIEAVGRECRNDTRPKIIEDINSHISKLLTEISQKEVRDVSESLAVNMHKRVSDLEIQIAKIRSKL